MARSRSRGRARTTKEKPARSVKSSRRAPAPAAEVEVVEEAGGATWEAGVAVATFLLLLVALLLIDKEMGTHYGEGQLFTYESSE